MSEQNIEKIKVADLHLWSENPRDPVDPASSDYDIIKRAVDGNPKEWNLDKLIEEMGDYYDLSEIPTVVFIEQIPVVFDGNRRVAVLKYLQNKNLYSSLTGKLCFKNGPKELCELVDIPCNVCDKNTALANIERKHANNGSWGILQREYFLHQHRNKPKSVFLMFEEATGLISAYNKLNQGFVRDEILTRNNLKSIGFDVKGDKLISIYNEIDTKKVLEHLIYLIEGGKLRTRTDKEKGTLRVTAGKLKDSMEEIEPGFEVKLDNFDESKGKEIEKNPLGIPVDIKKHPRRTPRTKKELDQLFGGSLCLKDGDTNNIYRDIVDLYEFYINNKNLLSENFPAMIRMSLRLLVESATNNSEKINVYVDSNFDEAKKTLTQDQKNTLSNNNIDGKQKLIQLLQSGAHNYTNSSNFEQTIAMSIIIAAMLRITHFKKSDN